MIMTTETKSKLKRFFKKYLIAIVIFIAILVIFRLLLPTIVKKYVNKSLSNLPGYYGQVEDIDISLLRGAYVINGLYLNVVDAGSQVPFLNFPETDISVEWKSLFKGSIVSEVYMTTPEVIYVLEDMQTSQIETEEEDWTQTLRDIIPISINHFEITDGKMAFVQTSADPSIDMQIHSINMIAENLRNVDPTDQKLPSAIKATGISIGQGQLDVAGRVNILKEIPDLDLDISLEPIDITAINDFSDHYGKIDFEEGDVRFFSEVVLLDSVVDGYFKVLFEDIKYTSEEDGFVEKIWEGLVSVFTFILKNQKTDNFALKAPIEGKVDNASVEVWTTIGSILKNAFIEGFDAEIDGELKYDDPEAKKNNLEDESESNDKKWFQFWKKSKKD